MSKGRKGIKFTEQHKHNLSKAKQVPTGPRSQEFFEKRGCKWFEVLDLSGKVIGRFISIKQCANELHVKIEQITNWLHNRVKSKKYILRFVDIEKDDL